MLSWKVAEAKAKFSEVLDRAEHEGPQIIRRKRREFFILTREQLDARIEANNTAPAQPEPFVSAWDLLRPPDNLCFDFDFPRAKGRARAARF